MGGVDDDARLLEPVDDPVYFAFGIAGLGDQLGDADAAASGGDESRNLVGGAEEGGRLLFAGWRCGRWSC